MVYGFLAVCGLLLTREAAHGWPVSWDEQISRWFSARRTSELNDLTHIGSMLSDTATAIAVTAVLFVVLRLWRRRWRESVALVVSIVGELWIFVGVTATVHRQRPTVPHLDPAPPTSSFPSGHTGAAVALYVGLAVILLSTPAISPPRTVRVVLAVLACCIPVIVALSRIYRGMHFATDVLAGAIAGGVWMAIVLRTLLAGHLREDRE